jgi:predicted TIM-barrel fold metal-dependent hydrolase
MLDATGMTYGVVVQVSVHGTDNGLMLRTLAANRRRLRGIAVVRHDAGDAELEVLKNAGVVGLRLNTTTGGGVGISHLDRYAAICEELGWHLQFLVEPHQLPDLVQRIAALKVPAVFDHMGYVHAGPCMNKARQALLQLVRDGAWVKLSGGFRLSRIGPPYMDTVALARMLAEAAPDRCVWGSDWPHVNYRGPMPNPGDLLDLLADWVPDSTMRNAILADNPRRLYGFVSPAA